MPTGEDGVGRAAEIVVQIFGFSLQFWAKAHSPPPPSA